MKKIVEFLKGILLTKKDKKFRQIVAWSRVMVAELTFAKDADNGLEKLGDYVQISNFYSQKLLPLLEGLIFNDYKRQHFIVGLKAVLSETAPSQDGWNRTLPGQDVYIANSFAVIPDSWSKIFHSRSVVEYYKIKNDYSWNFNGLNEYYFVQKMFVNPFIHKNYSELSKVVEEYVG